MTDLLPTCVARSIFDHTPGAYGLLMVSRNLQDSDSKKGLPPR
jgi:hypothetical protein